ncbi:MAG: hypothetical protein JWM91_1540 [Rhodospirillales bacterium]|nr:hypothetical protein [Rhodospirillales bacterium]
MLEDLRGRVVARWEATLREAGVASNDIERLAPCFTQSKAAGVCR